MNLPGLQGRAALVTGAASGIGLAAARQLAENGATKLVLCDIDGETLEANTADFSVPVVRMVGDVASANYWGEVAQHCADVDLYVLNAGAAKPKPIERFDYEDWRRMIGINLDGVWLGIQTGFRAMLAKGGGGAISVTGSSAGMRTDIGMTGYGVAKAGVHHLVRIAAKEGTQHRIRVNAVAPGGVATPIWRKSGTFNKLVAELGSEEAAFEKLGREGTPLGKYTSPDEIAGQLLFLLSDSCSTVTGEIFLNDGGFTL